MTGETRALPAVGVRMPEDDDAVTREEDPPILGYEHFRVAGIIQRLPALSRAELSALDGYEHAHAARPEILDAIEQLRGSEPWPGYDAMLPDQITTRLQTANPPKPGRCWTTKEATADAAHSSPSPRRAASHDWLALTVPVRRTPPRRRPGHAVVRHAQPVAAARWTIWHADAAVAACSTRC